MNKKNTISDLINFPVKYTFKIVGENSESFRSAVVEIFNEKEVLSLKWTDSRSNKYLSATVVIVLESEEEMLTYYKKIQNIKGIKFYL